MEWMLRLALCFFRLLAFICHVIASCVYRNKLPDVPPIKNPILKLSAASLARKIRLEEITSQAVVEVYIQRIKEVNPFLNAVIEDRFEAALADAKACDRKLKAGEVNAVNLEKEKPLFGVPFTVKESCSLKGLSQTAGTLVRQGMKAPLDSTVVEILKNAGGIPLCVTNTPEMCSGFDTCNLIYGRTHNPYDRRRIAGGSSGGEAALLGAGASTIGVGSDLAGSIRLPALFDGVFGHKPTPGIIPIKGHFPMADDTTFQTFLTIGPLARYAEDLHLATKLMSSKCDRNLRFDEPFSVKGLKVFYMEDAGFTLSVPRTTVEIRESIKKAAEYLKDHGAVVKESPLGSVSQIIEICLGMFFGMDDMPKILMDPSDPKHEKGPVIEFLKSIFGLSRYTKSAIFMALMKDINGLIPPSRASKYQADGLALRQKIINLLGEDGVFICPTFPNPAPFRNVIVLQVIGGVYCLLLNVFGFPSTHVPMGLNDEGLPIGFQVFAAPYQDRLCLGLAKELEKGFGGWTPLAAS